MLCGTFLLSRCDFHVQLNGKILIIWNMYMDIWIFTKAYEEDDIEVLVLL